MRILALTRYPALAASARCRFHDLEPHLRASGVDMRIEALLPEEYVRTLSVGGVGGMMDIASAYAHRAARLVSREHWDAILIQYEAFPFLPGMFERLLVNRGVPFVLDYDDAWFHRYDSHRSFMVRQALGRKIPTLMAKAAAVVAGSRYIADFAMRFNPAVHLIPTAIDLRRYPVAQPGTEASAPTIGWIGGPATTPFLNLVREPLREVMDRTGARLRLVGADAAQVSIPGAEVVPWSASSEIDELSSMSVGIMPVEDSLFARGKCAFKLIQYMGAWKPAVASPVGENVHVVANGASGFIAGTHDEWRDSLMTLLNDAALARRFGRAGRTIVAARYDQVGAASALGAVLRGVVRMSPPRR